MVSAVFVGFVCFLFERALGGASHPHLRLLEAEDGGDGGGYVVLHHALLNTAALADSFSADDEGCLHLEHGLAAVAFSFSSVVGCEDEDGLVGYAGGLCGADDAGYVGVEFVELGVVFGRVVADVVAHFVGVVEADGEERGALLLNVGFGHLAEGGGVVFVVGYLCVMTDGEGVDEVLDAFPFVEHADFGIGAGIAEQLENGGENAVFEDDARGQFGCARVPDGVAVELGTGAHEHRCPVLCAR